MSKKFKTAAKARTAIEFELDEVSYTFTPPKSAAMVMPLLDGGAGDAVVVKAGLDWLRDGLADGQYEALVSRLKDPKDDYDLPDLEELLEWLVEEVANQRPIL